MSLKEVYVIRFSVFSYKDSKLERQSFGLDGIIVLKYVYP